MQRKTLLLTTAALALAALAGTAGAASGPFDSVDPMCGGCGSAVEDLGGSFADATGDVIDSGDPVADAHYEIAESLVFLGQDTAAVLLGDVEGYPELAEVLLAPTTTWGEHLHDLLLAAFDDPDAVLMAGDGAAASAIEIVDANTVQCFATPGDAITTFTALQVEEFGLGLDEQVHGAWETAWITCMDAQA